MNENLRREDFEDDEPLPDGEEAAPPHTKTMGVVRWVLLGAISLFALIMVLSFFDLTPWGSTTSGSTQYHCPMHPTYVSNQPGDCPICGMSLVEIGSSEDRAADTSKQAETLAKPGQYSCPMHPEVVSDTAGRCPKCNMFLEKVPENAGKYVCPMHPEVVSDQPGQCPKCGMNLKLVPSSSGSSSMEDQSMGSAPVPGLVPVTIEPERQQLIGVRTESVELRRLGSRQTLVGYLVPDEGKIANVHVRISGWVQKLFVNQTGESVKRGDPLLSVYSQELFEAEQDYLQAIQYSSRAAIDSLLALTRTELKDASRERLRLLGMNDSQIQELEAKGKAENTLTIRSPFDGVAIEKSVFEGGYITPDQNLFTIADLRTLWVIADVYEGELGSVSVGQEADVTIDALPGESFAGTVQFVYPTISTGTRSAKVRVELKNPDLKLRPGMYGSVEIRSEQEKVLTISNEAIMDGGDTKYAFVVTGGTRFEPRLLEIGRRANNYSEVLSGLSEGEQVVSSANFLIDSESRLKAAISGMGSSSEDTHVGHGQ